MAQDFSQRPDIDYVDTYSPVVNVITFRYLINLAVHEKLEMRLIDVATTYLYCSLDHNIFMKVLEAFNMFEAYKNSKKVGSIRLQKSLYGLKQSGRMRYNLLSQFLLKEGYRNDPICPCVFIKRSGSDFVITDVYVGDLNISGTPNELSKVVECLTKEFEMKDLGKTKFCLGLQIEHLKNEIFVHQSTYTKNILKRFYMDKSHPLNTLMVVRPLGILNDPFRPQENEEELLDEAPYLTVIKALIILPITLNQISVLQ